MIKPENSAIEVIIVAVPETAGSALYGMVDVLLAAKRLLEAGELPLDEISFVVGYEDASFFRRLFKRLTGLTPSKYRKMFKPVVEASA
jgi:transcriptional regulator GlxA family with amidase domain